MTHCVAFFHAAWCCALYSVSLPLPETSGLAGGCPSPIVRVNIYLALLPVAGCGGGPPGPTGGWSGPVPVPLSSSGSSISSMLPPPRLWWHAVYSSLSIA